MTTHQHRVADYYDRNTRGFLRFGSGGHNLAIHRSVWAPGVKNRTQAALYVNKRIEEHAAAINALNILDLGCGVGGTLIDLARAREARYAGVTISRTQKQLADELVLKEGLQEHIRIFEGDFTDPKVFRLFPGQDLIYAVESMIHLPAETDISTYIADSLVPGGRFVLCDDMLCSADEELENKERSVLKDFKAYWHTPGIRSAEEWVGIFKKAGLEALAAEDFSTYLKLFTPRNMAAALSAPLARNIRKPWAANLVGGAALRHLLRRGIIQYRFLVFQKPREGLKS